ncbi:MAG: rod shape-determining protein RodA [Atribacterota bacterium]|jgi:rod shape determining protein RodA|nr:rod shape-determining protein RodA [Atribacterota bacterium]MDY0382379.1 rod shape-determining protein RodA [Atribacterota bacterium]
MSVELKSSNILSGKSFFNQHLRLFKHVDFTLIFLVTGLCILGLLVIYSTTHQENINEGVMQITRRQLIHILTGLFFCLLVTIIDYHDIVKIAIPLFFLSLIMLVYVIFFGKNVGGSRRWIQLAGFEFQPAEFAKITLIIFLADFLNKQKEEIPNFLYFSLPFFFTGILMLLIYKQPDLGTAIVFFAITLLMIFIAGISWKYIIAVFIILVSLFPIGWSFLKDYQKSRLLLFLNPEMDPLGAGYNIIQSKVAIGSGGLFGQGLFSGIQSQLKFLPAQHTDFVFAVIGEELGFMGALLLISLFILVLWKGIRIAQEAPDILGTLIATGVTSFMFIHILINVGMSMGLMPATGLPLPFISHGGTFMITNFIGIGLLLNIHLRSIFV